jgi:hypothetical protein
MYRAQRSVRWQAAREFRARLAAWRARWRRWRGAAAPLALAWMVTLAGLAMPARANEGVTIDLAELSRIENGDPGFALGAQFTFELPPVLEDAVNRGIALYFVIDFEAYRSRWYWFDRKLVDAALTYRLTYSPLTRQYRLARGALAQPFDTLGEALATLKRVRGWRVADAGNLGGGGDVRGYVRFRLDVSQLPKPFQVSALTNRDWNLSSDWAPVVIPPDVLAR